MNNNSKKNNENNLVIDSKFNFTKDLHIIRTRISTIINSFEKDIKYFTSHIDIKTIFSILIEAKNELSQISNKYTETINRLAPTFKNTTLDELEFYEIKMIIISLTIMFEAFYRDIVLLGAFYNTEFVLKYFELKDDYKKVVEVIEKKDAKEYGR